MDLIIIVTSNEPWGNVWFSKHHYAHELAKLGFKVYFLDPPGKWHPLHFFSSAIKKFDVNEYLTIVRYKNPFPVRIIPAFFLLLNDFLNSIKIRRLTKGAPNIVFWQFDPFRFIHVFFHPKAKRLYHVTDPFSHIPTDKQLAKKADLVVNLLEREMDKYFSMNTQVIHIPHGLNGKMEPSDLQLVKLYRHTFGRYLLVIGTFNDDYDFDLMQKIASNTEVNLVLIGPDLMKTQANRFSFDHLVNLSNVTWFGPLHPSEIVSYIEASAACLVPYRFGIEYSKGSSIKILHYLQQGKPVITSIITGYESIQGEGVYYVTEEKKFVDTINMVLKHDEKLNNDAIDSYLKKVEYPTLINNILLKLFNTD